MRNFRLFAPVSLLMLANAFMVSGCVVDREHTVREQPVPNEGYYDREHHRWYHENAWVVCDDRDPHCPS
ncbi:MAG TPA: hypothetical protein VL176_01105 [Steroidobacteraceae bacterium]|jgi:hypothetical protein|nr:hypothetical protein [Steroidobacteraceae bacterium]